MSETDQGHQDEVRRRAYEPWEKAGQPDGRNEEFWHTALAEVSNEGEGEKPQAGDVPAANQPESTTISTKANGKGA
jgi:hypothetical protein